MTDAKLHRLGLAADDLIDYLEKVESGEVKLERVKVMTWVHAINYAYAMWADGIDRANLTVVD